MSEKKKKLAIFTHNLADIGGTPKCAHNQIRGLTGEYEIYYFAYQDGFRRGLLERDGIKVAIGKDNKAIRKLIKINKIDIFHLHRHGRTDETSELIRICRPYVKKLIETNVFGVYDPTTAKYIDYHIFISDFGCQRVLAQDPTIKGSFVKLNFDVEDFFLAEKAYTNRIVGRHSRPSFLKWHDVCVEAPILLKNRGVEFEYLVLGATQEVEQRLRSAGVHLRLEQNTDGNEIVKKVLSEISIFVHGSVIGEIHPGNILEAFCAKTPVITFDSGHPDIGHVQFVQQSGAGFVAKTVEEYAAYMEQLLSRPAECRELGNLGFYWVKNNFSTHKVLGEYRAILAEP